MEPEKYRKFILNSTTHIRNAAVAAAETGEDRYWNLADDDAARFVAQTADAAEHLARAMLGRRGIDPEGSHDAELLAEQAERAGHSDLSEAVRQMDGFTRQDHLAGYDSTVSDRFCHAVLRLPVAIQRLEMELAAAARDPKFAEEVAGLAIRAARVVARAADALRGAGLLLAADTEPPPPYAWLGPLPENREILLSELLQPITS